MNRCTSFSLLFGIATLPSVALCAWPDRPIKIIVPYAPGAAGDVLIRYMQPVIQERLGQPLVIENKSGAGGNIGTQEVVRSKADGYTFVLGATNNFVINQFVYKNMGFNPLDTLSPVTKLISVPPVIFVNASVLRGHTPNLCVTRKPMMASSTTDHPGPVRRHTFQHGHCQRPQVQR